MPGDVIETVRAGVQALSIEKDYKVVTADAALSANEALGMIKTLEKQLEASRKAEVEPLNEQIRTINAKYTDPRDLLFNAERVIKGALIVFRDVEHKQLEDKRRIEAEAATKERGRLEEQARKQREKAAAEAAKLEAKGQSERAQAALALGELQAGATEHVAQLVTAPVSTAAPTKLAGSSFRQVWYGKVTDPKTFLLALLSSPYNLSEVVAFKDAGLKKLAGTLQDKMDKVLPGSIAWPEDQIAARAK